MLVGLSVFHWETTLPIVKNACLCFTSYTYFKKPCRGERRLHDRNELWVPFGMQNFTTCVGHAYACVASENQALQFVYPFSSKGNATSEILHPQWYPQFISVVQPPFSPTTFFEKVYTVLLTEAIETQSTSTCKTHGSPLRCQQHWAITTFIFTVLSAFTSIWFVKIYTLLNHSCIHVQCS